MPNNLLLLPLHIVLLELIIDPTCSIVLERQPAESNIMSRSPRDSKENILNKKTLIKSVIQGLVIFVFSFGTYYISFLKTGNERISRTMGLGIIILANMFLVLINSSKIESTIVSIKKLAKDKVMWLALTLTLIMLTVIIYTPLNQFLKLQALSIYQLAEVIILAFVSVFWYEIVKVILRKKE